MPSDTASYNAAIGGALLVGVIGGLIGLAIGIIIWWIIFSKAGYNGARSLLLLIPIVNLIILLIFVFGEWPVRRELMMLRQQVAMMQQQYGRGPGQSNPNYPNYPPQQYR